MNGAESEQQSCVVSVGFQNNLSATVSDRGTSKSCYCCGCQTEIQDSTPIPLSDIYLFFQLRDSNPNKHCDYDLSYFYIFYMKNELGGMPLIGDYNRFVFDCSDEL